MKSIRKICEITSICGLLLTVVPSFFVLYGKITWDLHATLMLIGMILWFTTAPFRKKSIDPDATIM